MLIGILPRIYVFPPDSCKHRSLLIIAHSVHLPSYAKQNPAGIVFWQPNLNCFSIRTCAFASKFTLEFCSSVDFKDNLSRNTWYWRLVFDEDIIIWCVSVIGYDEITRRSSYTNYWLWSPGSDTDKVNESERRSLSVCWQLPLDICEWAVYCDERCSPTCFLPW